MDLKIIWEIIKVIVDLILKGSSKSDAISAAAKKFNMSESEVKNIYSKYK